MNYNYVISMKEELISELTSSKIALELKVITEEEYKVNHEAILGSNYYSEYVEKASDVACAQVMWIIEQEIKNDVDCRDGVTILNPKGKSGNILCDVVMISKSNIHLMKIVSMECDLIEPDKSKELMKIAYEALDRFICETNSETIDLTVIQPNLLTSSMCTVNIDSLKDRGSLSYL